MPPYWVAELCSNWGGQKQYARIRSLINDAHLAGFDSVKLQYLNVEAMWPDCDPRRDQWRDYQIPLRIVGSLYEMCRELDMALGVSVFCPGDADAVATRCDWLKVAASESDWVPLIRAVRATKKPWIISTPPGWLDLGDVTATEPFPIYRLHTIPQYPCAPSEANLACMDYMSRVANPLVGYSDHTRDPIVVTRAVVDYDAQCVELHWSGLSGTGIEAGHSWNATQYAKLKKSIAKARAVDGGECAVSESMRHWWATSSRDDATGYRR